MGQEGNRTDGDAESQYGLPISVIRKIESLRVDFLQMIELCHGFRLGLESLSTSLKDLWAGTGIEKFQRVIGKMQANGAMLRWAS